jgi:hypothetical protein
VSDENKTISGRLAEEAFAGGNLDLVDALVAQTHKSHDPAGPRA